MRKKVMSLLLLAALAGGCSAQGKTAETKVVTEATTTIETTAMTTAVVEKTEDTEGDGSDEDTVLIDPETFKSSTEFSFVLDSCDFEGEPGQGAWDNYENYPVYADGEDVDNVASDLYLPTEVDGVDVTWISSDETYLLPDGTVKRPHGESVYVMLTGIFTSEEGSITTRTVIRIIRDMYDDMTVNDIPDLDRFTDSEYRETISDLDGWCFNVDNEDEIYAIGYSYPEATYSFEDIRRSRFSTVYGVTTDMHVDNNREAYLYLYSFRKLLEWEPRYELRYNRSILGEYSSVYDFDQYYKGVRTSGHVRLLSHERGNCVDVIGTIIDIPEDLNVEPDISKEEVEERYGFLVQELLIDDYYSDEVSLVWKGYDWQYYYVVDAHTGELLDQGSTLVT